MTSPVVFFDIGQTLVTGADQSPRRLLAARLGLTEKEARTVGKLIMTHSCTEPSPLALALREVLPDRDPAGIREAVEALWSEQIACAREIPGATSLLSSLKEKGYKLGIISNIWHPFYMGFCSACPEVLEWLDFTILSYREGRKKPSPALYEHAVRLAAVPASSCWMVGDTYELDVAPACEAGMRSIWLLSRPEREKALLVEILRGERRRPDWTVETLGELQSFFSTSGSLPGDTPC